MNKHSKRIILVLTMAMITAVLVLCAACGGGGGSVPAADCVRIHIRANSSSGADQTVKYEVRDEVIYYLNSELKTIKTYAELMRAVDARLAEITARAQSCLKRAGKLYTAKALIKREYFAERVYENTRLPAGYYDALIVELGSAGGENWWCVVYPPLGYYGDGEQTGAGVVYKSKIMEWFK